MQESSSGSNADTGGAQVNGSGGSLLAAATRRSTDLASSPHTIQSGGTSLRVNTIMYNLYSSPSASRFIRSLFRLELNLTVTSALEHLSTGKKNGIDLRATVSRETKYDQQKFPYLYTLNAISPRLRPLRCIDYQSSSRRSALVLFATGCSAILRPPWRSTNIGPPTHPLILHRSSRFPAARPPPRPAFHAPLAVSSGPEGRPRALVDESGALLYAPRIDTRAQPCDRCKRYNETLSLWGLASWARFPLSWRRVLRVIHSHRSPLEEQPPFSINVNSAPGKYKYLAEFLKGITRIDRTRFEAASSLRSTGSRV